MRFYQEVTKIALPFRVDVGLVGAADRTIAHMNAVFNSPPAVLASDEISHSAVLNSVDEQTQISFLMAFFEKLPA